GMGLAAPIDSATGTAYVEGILPSWGGISPAQEMATRLGLPVQIENDANVGALGEHMFGAGRGVDDMVYVRLSAGIGLGLMLGGELAGAGPVLLDPLRQAIERRAIAPAVAAVRVTEGALGERAEVLGAAALLLSQAPHALARRLA